MKAIVRLCLAAAFALPVAARQIEAMRVFPADINLTTSRDRQSVVVQLVLDDQVTRDVTKRAAFSLADDKIARVENATLIPLADGETELIVSYGAFTNRLPVRVTRAAEDRPISFKLDVMPVFAKASCNSGGCHGSSRGQDGFRLSLFGFDPEGDYFRITREQNGRRINLASPEDSLLIQKSIGGVQHTGGDLFKADSAYCDTLLRWLRAGVPMDDTNIPHAVSLELLPNRIVLQGSNELQQLVARVRYSDGTDRDVTADAVFISNNDPSANVSKQGLIRAGQRGEAFVMARYDTFTVGAQVIVIPSQTPYAWNDAPENNYIDGLVYRKLQKLRLLPSDLCTDGEFIRRIHLDLVGQLPERDAVQAFITDPDPGKRAKLVDSLLARKEFVEMWVMKWAELLQIRSNNDFSYKSAILYFNWLQDRIAKGMPIDEIVREVLGSRGGTFKNPETNYYQVETEMLKVAENAAQVFMGMRLQCAQCHNHPFDRWTMNDYYGFAAFFSQIGRKKGEDPRETIVFNQGSGETKHPVTKKDMAPTFLGGGPADLQGRDRRVVMAEWLTSTNNPFFAQNIANIVWAHFFGQGIIDPVDDVRVSNPPSNPELLEELGRKLVAYQYDFRRLVRDICTSRTYQLSTTVNDTNASDLRNFSHAQPRRIRSEVLLDCLSQVTGTKNKFQGLPLGARAVQIADGTVSTYFLKTFGRATRDTVNASEVVMEPSLSQALHLLNGENTHQKLESGGVVRKLVSHTTNTVDVVADLYWRCLARPPTEAETRGLMTYIGDDADRNEALDDVFWALLNSKEFIFNH